MANSQTTRNRDEILTRGEAAELLKLPKRTLDYLVGTGQMPFARIGKRSVRFTRKRLLEWLSEREGIEYRLPRVADNRAEQ
jgi:excisionase family DNA binding protein